MTMEFHLKSIDPAKRRSQCTLIGVFEKQPLSGTAKALDTASKKLISSLKSKGDFTGKLGETLVIHHPQHLPCKRLLLVGCGDRKELTMQQYRKALIAGFTALKTTGASDALCALLDVPVAGCDDAWKIRQAVELLDDAFYLFTELKSNNNQHVAPLENMTFVTDCSDDKLIKQGQAIALGMRTAKDLANLPANICTPDYLATQAKALAKKSVKVTTEILSEEEMEKLGMHSLLSVTRGSDKPAKLISIQYQGADEADKPIVLVGKGVTFDAGGISIKPAQGMEDMKFDMCGAAAVLGTITAVIKLKLPINVVVLIPTTENLLGGSASKPGDVVKSMSGQTIEILNTDAEGRLILCDALTYAKRFKPDTVIDIATLTGACVIALGNQACGLFSNNDSLADALVAAGTSSGDRAWRLPIWEEYQDQINSTVADMANVGSRAASSITAACFLARFTKQYRWAHIDIAGTAYRSGEEKGATGRGVPLLMHYLIARSQ